MSTLYSHELIAVIHMGHRNAANEGLDYGVRPNAGSFDAAAAPLSTGPLTDWWLNVAVRPSFAGILSATAKGVLQPASVTQYTNGSGDVIGEDYLDALDVRLGGWRFWKTGPTNIYADPFAALAAMNLTARNSFDDDALIQAALAAEPSLDSTAIAALHAAIDLELEALQSLLGGAESMRGLVGVGEGLAKVMI
jgi:hypothetical protein